MGSVWLKNFAGAHCTDYELLKVPHPKIELCIHITFKTVQLGTFAGSLLVGPLMHTLRRGASDGRGMRESAIKGGLYGAAIGLVAGPLITAGFTLASKSKLQVYDNCYRLRYSNNQMLADRLTAVGALVGGGLAGAPGLVAGIDLALMCSFIINGVTSYKKQVRALV